MSIILDSQDDALGVTPVGRVPYWRDNVQAWDKPTMAGTILPGTVTLSAFGPELNIHEGAAAGKDGGKLLIRGMKFAPAEFTLEIDTREDFFRFQQLAPTLMPVTQPQERNLLAIYHPVLALFRFSRGLVSHIAITPPRNGGPLVVKVKLLMAIDRDNATHVPTQAASSRAAVPAVQSVPLAGGFTDLRDVRDRNRPAVP
jgi:hypothetical protein